MDLEKICKQTVSAVKEAGEYIACEKGRKNSINIEEKGLHNFVTRVDTTAEKMLVERLSEILPGSGFITEEGTAEKRDGEYNWVIDPLDGTTNFIHGLPPYSVSVALLEEEKVVAGVVHEINLNECFYSWKGAPAFLNGRQINVSETKKVNDSLIATGFPFTDYSLIRPFLKCLEHCMQKSRGVRRLGSAAVDLAYLACGRFDAFYEYGLSPWDVAAGGFIIQQAGGKVTDFSGGDKFLYGGEIIAANSFVFKEFFQMINGFMEREKK